MVKNLRMLRVSRNLSQQQLADVVGVSQQSINKYEKQKIEPDISTLIALADYFGTTVDFLIGHTSSTACDPQQDLEFSKSELALVRDFRRLSGDEKKSIQLVMQNYLKHMEETGR